MKVPSLILASALALPLTAQTTVYTIPQGYTKLTIPAAAGGSPTLSVISATLLNDVAFSGAVSIASDYDTDPDSDPSTTNAAQSVTSTGASWSSAQFTAEPHLAYLVNASGAEESFLITSHTADTLTIDGSFDLLADSRFSAASTIKIRKANTVGSILGTTETPFSSNDRAYVWTGDNWQTLVAVNGAWFYVGGIGGVATDAVVFPEEGIFISRAEPTNAELTLFGEVPSLSQASTVAGASSHFVSTRFPVGDSPAANPTGIELQNLNIEQIPGWTTTDRVYFWTGSEWQTLVFAAGNWRFVGGPTSGAIADQLLVPANSALFISRQSAGDPATSPLTLELPYDVITSE